MTRSWPPVQRLEGPAKWAGGAVPVTNEVLDAGRAKPVDCIARAREGLAFQDAEPDFGLVQPRGMERKELEPHTALLSGEPRADLWCCVNRQVVEDDDQAAVGVAATECLEKFEELAPTPSSPHAPARGPTGRGGPPESRARHGAGSALPGAPADPDSLGARDADAREFSLGQPLERASFASRQSQRPSTMSTVLHAPRGISTVGLPWGRTFGTRH